METRINPTGIIFTAAFGAFLATFNETFMNVALVPIMADLSVDAGTVQWLATAYMLVAAVLVPVTGFLYRSVSARLLCLVAAVTLVGGSVVGFLAQSFAVLLVGRIIQAIGSGMIPAVCMNLTLAAVPKARLGTAMGIVGAATTLGPSAGPLVAGLMLAVFSWESLFALFGVASLIWMICVALIVKPIVELTHPKLDALSVALVTSGLVAAMLGISGLFTGVLWVALAELFVGLALLAWFLVRQTRLEEPLIDLRPFATPAFTVSISVVTLTLMTVFAMNMILPTFLQESLGFSAFSAAITLFPAVMCACIASPFAGRIYDRHGAKVLLPVGMVLMIAAEAALWGCGMLQGIAIAGALVALLYAPVAVGSGLVFGPAQTFALSKLPAELNPHGVTLISMVFQVAGCIGSSLFMGMYAMGQTQGSSAGMTLNAASMQGFLWAVAVAVVIAAVNLALGLAVRPLEKRRSPAREADAVAGAADVLNEIMKREVFNVPATASVYDALACMAARKTSGLPVLGEHGELVGFIGEGDIVRYIAGDAGSPALAIYAMWTDGTSFKQKLEEIRTMNVMELATPVVVSVERSDGIEAAAKLLSQHRIKKLPVTESGRVVGTISRSDFMRHLFNESTQAEM